MKVNSTCHSYGNSPDHKKPNERTIRGRELFESIIQKCRETKSSRETLIKTLQEMVSVRENGIRIESEQHIYGSRTWTVILVDRENNVQFVEENCEEPISFMEGKITSPVVSRGYSFKIGE